MLNALVKLNKVGIMVCSLYISFVVKRNSTYFVTDTHVIRKHIGGSENSIAIEFSNGKSCIN